MIQSLVIHVVLNCVTVKVEIVNINCINYCVCRISFNKCICYSCG